MIFTRRNHSPKRYRHQQNNHILSHLCPYQAHTQDKLMSCLVLCTRHVRDNTFRRTVSYTYTLASSATSVHLWHYHQKKSPCSHATLDVYNSFWQIPALESCSTNLVLSKTKFLLELADAAAPTYFRSCGNTSPPEFFSVSRWRSSTRGLGQNISTAQSSSVSFFFCDEFSPFGDNNSQKQIMSKISFPLFKIELPKIEKQICLKSPCF